MTRNRLRTRSDLSGSDLSRIHLTHGPEAAAAAIRSQAEDMKYRIEDQERASQRRNAAGQCQCVWRGFCGGNEREECVAACNCFCQCGHERTCVGCPNCVDAGEDES